MENWKIKIVDVGYKFERDMYIYYKMMDNKIGVLHGDTIETFNSGDAIKPTLSLPPEALQELANALDAIGFKPKEGFLEGKLQAIEKHLEDMRTLVFEEKENATRSQMPNKI